MTDSDDGREIVLQKKYPQFWKLAVWERFSKISAKIKAVDQCL